MAVRLWLTLVTVLIVALPGAHRGTVESAATAGALGVSQRASVLDSDLWGLELPSLLAGRLNAGQSVGLGEGVPLGAMKVQRPDGQFRRRREPWDTMFNMLVRSVSALPPPPKGLEPLYWTLGAFRRLINA